MTTQVNPITPFVLRPNFGPTDIERLLIEATQQKCSDIKIQSSDFVNVRKAGKWHCLSNRALEHSEVERILSHFNGSSAITRIGGGGEVDDQLAFFADDSRETMMRFRSNALGNSVGTQSNGITITLRTIPDRLPEFNDMGVHPDIADDLLSRKGLVIVVGATGSGKTTLIASCIHERLKEYPVPCVGTYEQPPEFGYGKLNLGRGPLVSQIHVGIHIGDWNRAIPTAMRRTLDIILMGEMRDTKSTEATLEASLTGHMVYSTMHCDTPHEAIFRLVEMFPEESRSSAAAKMLGSLRVILAQKLVNLKSGRTVPIRSWLSFDSDLKDQLTDPSCPYPHWASFVRKRVAENGHDFATQCIPFIQQGELTMASFREITGMGKHQAEEFFGLHSQRETG